MCVCAYVVTPMFLTRHPVDTHTHTHTHTRMHRPRGHALVLSGSGVGRYESVQLPAHMRRCAVVRPAMTAAYTLRHFRSELKAVVTRMLTEPQDVILFVRTRTSSRTGCSTTCTRWRRGARSQG